MTRKEVAKKESGNVYKSLLSIKLLQIYIYF